MEFESQGVMVSIEEAIEILSERIPKNITLQGVVFEETYNKAVRRSGSTIAAANKLEELGIDLISIEMREREA